MEDLYEDREDIFGGIGDDDDDCPYMMDRGSRKTLFHLNGNAPLPANFLLNEDDSQEKDNQQQDKNIDLKDDDEIIPDEELEQKKDDEIIPEGELEQKKDDENTPDGELEQKKDDEITPDGELEQKKDDEITPDGEIEQKKDDEITPDGELEQKKDDENKPKGEIEQKKDDDKTPKGEPEQKNNEIINNKKQSYMNRYQSEDGQYYIVLFEETKNEIIISLTNVGSENDNSPFTSKYEIDYLNEKLGKKAYFRSIFHFRECLINNIERKLLKIKKPYKNVINTVWKLYPKDYKDKRTFTLISSQSWEKNLSLIFYSNHKKAEKIIKQIEAQAQINPKKINDKKDYKEQIYDKLIENIIFLGDKYDKDNDDKKKEILCKIIEENKKEKEKRNINYRNIIIFFDEKKINDIIMDLVKKYYENQLFIFIFTNENVEKLRAKIQSKVDSLKERRKSYFDMNNIFILKNDTDGHKKILLPILKVFSYFNQLGDGFFKQLSDMGLKIDNLDKEFKHLYHTHYFNILLCGKSGAGKSTFINAIMGEKKAFTLKNISAGTYRNNYYIHKDYPIKIIDVCGMAEGSEAKENLERFKLIYNEDLNNIIIDEYTNDSFSFYGDKRNNIHLLLYFGVYNDKYDIVSGELRIILEAIDKKIPIIFIVNKCPDDIFEDQEEKDEILEEIKKAREKTDYVKYKTYLINCLSKNGFGDLLDGIFNNYKKYLISTDNLNKIKNNTIIEEEFNTIFKDSIFFGNISPKDVFLNESLINSVIDIKSLVVKLAGFYSKELSLFPTLKFYLFNQFYNYLHKNSETNFFPLLTDLVKKIYNNFGHNNKSTEECNNYIKTTLKQYFKIKIEEKKENEKDKNKDKDKDKEKKEEEEDDDTPYEDDDDNNDVFNFEQFKKDYINLGKLYWFSKQNFKIEEDKTENVLKNINNNLAERIFNLEEENNKIDPERMLQMVKRDFGLDNNIIEKNNQERMILKLFYISYVCNELTSSLCGEINKKGFKYRSIYNFYYTVSKSYNDAINGFIKIKEDMGKKQKKKNKNHINEEEDEAAPEVYM